MSFGEFLKERRKMVGLSQVELADSLSYSPQVISKWEKGTSYPPLSLSSEIAKLLELSLDDFFKMDASSQNYVGSVPSFDANAFSKQLKIYRTYSGLTQKRVNELTGINYQTIQRFENGKSTPNVDEFLKLSEVYQLEPSFMYEAKDVVKMAKIEEIPAKKTANWLLITLSTAVLVVIVSVSTAAVLLSKHPVSDTQASSQSLITSSVPASEYDTTFPEDFSFSSSIIRVDGHDEYQLSIKFKNIDKYKKYGYRCKVSFKDTYLTEVNTLSIPGLEDEYVTMTTNLSEYCKSGEYLISSLTGFYPKMDNGVMMIEEEEIHLSNVSNAVTIENPRQDVTAPVLKSLKMFDKIDEKNPECFLFHYYIECADDLSGIQSVIIQEHYKTDLFPTGWYGVNYESKDKYPTIILKEDLTVPGSISNTQKDLTLSSFSDIEYFVVTLMDAAKNIATISLPAENVFAF